MSIPSKMGKNSEISLFIFYISAGSFQTFWTKNISEKKKKIGSFFSGVHPERWPLDFSLKIIQVCSFTSKVKDNLEGNRIRNF